MKRELYTITTLSNLHVGSGDINFDIIDKQVQRDAVTTLPVIHSSSLKGAFREASGSENQYTKYVFGPENNENDSHQTGAYHFFEAALLTRPVRSNKKPFFNATSVAAIKSFLSVVEDFDIAFDETVKTALVELAKLKPTYGKPLIFEDLKGVVLEDGEAETSSYDTAKLEGFLGENLALFDDEDFKELELPVLARNSLENGVSQNLWYEEVVPKKSKFYFVVAKPTNLDDADARENLNKYDERFDKECLVQFGANKSIGYGLSKVQKVSL
jgi:CRISPR-associated protein Cmr4